MSSGFGFGAAKAPPAAGTDTAKAPPAAPAGFGAGGGAGAKAPAFGSAAKTGGDSGAAPAAGTTAPAPATGGFGAGAAPAPAAGAKGFGAGGGFGGGAAAGAAAPAASGGFGGAAAPAAPDPAVAARPPIDVATVRSALRNNRVDDGVAALMRQHLAAPLKKKAAAPAATAGGAASASAFDSADHDRATNDLQCLIVLLTSDAGTPGLFPVLQAIVPKVVSNLASYLAVPPPPPATTGRFAAQQGAAASAEAREASMALSAAELLLLIASSWQVTEDNLKELLAAVQARIEDVASSASPLHHHRDAMIGSAAVSPAATHAHSVYLLVLSLVSALNVWGLLRKTTNAAGAHNITVTATGERVGTNDLCKPNAPMAKNLTEWLKRVQAQLSPPAEAGDDAAVATSGSSIGGGFGGLALGGARPQATGAGNDRKQPASPLAGKLLSICGLAIGSFIAACEDDAGLDMALEATQSHTMPPRLGGIGHGSSAATKKNSGGSGSSKKSAAAAQQQQQQRPQGVAAIPGYGKALANIAALLPPPEALTMAVQIPARAAFRLVRHVVGRLAPLVRHLANLDVASYRRMAGFIEALAARAARPLEQEEAARQLGTRYHAPAVQRREELPPAVVTTFHVPQLLGAITHLMTHLPIAELYDDDAEAELEAATAAADDDGAAAAAAPARVSNILHLLLGNLPSHLRLVFDVRRGDQSSPLTALASGMDSMAFGGGAGAGSHWDAPTAKVVGAYVEALAFIAQCSTDFATKVVKTLAQQVDCPEVQLQALIAQLRANQSGSSSQSRSAGASSGRASSRVLGGRGEAESIGMHDAQVASQCGVSSVRQLTLGYLDDKHTSLSIGIVHLLRSLAARLGASTVERFLPMDAAFELVTAPQARHPVAGELLGLAAAMVRSPNAAATALSRLERHGLLTLDHPDAATTASGDRSDADSGRRSGFRGRDSIAPPAAASASSSSDLYAAFEQEARVASYHVTIGFLRLANAIAEYPLPPEATRIVRFVSHTILCGFTRRSYSRAEDRHVVGGLSFCLLYRALNPGSWAAGVVPFNAVLAPTRSPSDVLGDCLAVITSAAKDLAVRPQAVTPARIVCLREALRLATATVAPASAVSSHDPSSSNGASSAAGAPPSAGAILQAGSSAAADSAAVSLAELHHGRTVTFAMRARTYESASFVGDLVRLSIIDDTVSASLALELAAVLMPASSGAIVRDLESSHAASHEARARLVDVVLPGEPYNYEPARIPACFAGTVGLCGYVDVTPSRATAPDATAAADGDSAAVADGNPVGLDGAAADGSAGHSDAWNAFVNVEQDRLRRAVLDLALRGASSHSPALTMWLCGYPNAGNVIAGVVGGRLPPWVIRGLANAAGSGHGASIEPNRLLDAVLSSLNSPSFCAAKPLLAAKYTKLLVLLVSNPSTNTPALQWFLEARDGLDFVDAVYDTLSGDAGASGGNDTVNASVGDATSFHQGSSTVGNMSTQLIGAAQSGGGVQAPDAAAVVYRAAFTVKLLVLELYNAAARPAGSHHHAPPGEEDTSFAARHLAALTAPTQLPAARRLAVDAGVDYIPTIGSWLIAALDTAPRMPDLPRYTVADSAVLVIPCANAATGAPFPDPFSAAPAEQRHPYYDVARIYNTLRGQDAKLPEEQRRTPEQHAALLETYIQANFAIRCHAMVCAFVDVWAQLVELITVSFSDSLALGQHVALVHVLLAIVRRLGETGMFASSVRDHLVTALTGAIASLLATHHRRIVNLVRSEGSADTTATAAGDDQQNSSVAGVSVGVVTSTVDQLATMLMRHVSAQSCPAVKYNLYTALLAWLQTARTVRVAVDSDLMFRMGGALFTRLSADGTEGPAAGRILALSCLQLLIADRPAEVLAAILGSSVNGVSATGTRKAGGTSALLSQLVASALSAFDREIGEIVAAYDVERAASLSEWLDAFGAVLSVIAHHRPHELANTDLLRSVNELGCWPPLVSSLISDADTAAPMAGANGALGAVAAPGSATGLNGSASLLGGIAGASGLTAASLPTVLASRAFLTFFDVFVTLATELPRHTIALQSIAEYVANSQAVVARLMTPQYVLAAARLAVSSPKSNAAAMLPIRLVNSVTMLLQQLSRTSIARSLPALCRNLQLPHFVHGVADLTRQVAKQTPGLGRGHRGTATDSTGGYADSTSSNTAIVFLGYAVSVLGNASAVLLNTLQPISSVADDDLVSAGTQESSHSPRGGGASRGDELGLADLSPTRAGRDITVDALSIHAALVDIFARPGTEGATGGVPTSDPTGADVSSDAAANSERRAVLDSVLRSAQVLGVAVQVDIARGDSSVGGGEPLSAKQAKVIRDVAAVLKKAAAAGAHAEAQLSQRTAGGSAAGGPRLFGRDFTTDVPPVGDVTDPAAAATVYASQALDVILHALVDAAETSGAR